MTVANDGDAGAQEGWTVTVAVSVTAAGTAG